MNRVRLLLGLSIFLFANAALAQRSLDEAHEHYRKGTAAYNLGHYAEAAREYEATYEITLDVAVLFNTAQAYRLAGENHKAILAYKGYLRAAPAGSQRDIAQQKLDELTKLEKTSATTAPTPVPVLVPTTPVPVLLPLLPAATAAAQPSAPALQIIPITASAPQPAPNIAPTAVVVATPATQTGETHRSLYKRWPFWTVVGATVVALVVVGLVVGSSGGGLTHQDTTYGSMSF
jgi:tetratricopeptide (TPR) repeat protein